MSADAGDIGRQWAEHEWEVRTPERRLERWRPLETDAFLLLLDIPAEQRPRAVEVAAAAESRWLELLGYELAGPEEGE